MKIHIVGPTGSGKTKLALDLGQKFDIPHYELDAIMIKNEVGKLEQHSATAKAQLTKQLFQDNWIFISNGDQLFNNYFSQADVIVVLDIPTYQNRWQIISNFFKNHLLKIEKNDKSQKTFGEAIKMLWEQLQSEKKYRKITRTELIDKLMPFESKVIVYASATIAFEDLVEHVL